MTQSCARAAHPPTWVGCTAEPLAAGGSSHCWDGAKLQGCCTTSPLAASHVAHNVLGHGPEVCIWKGGRPHTSNVLGQGPEVCCRQKGTGFPHTVQTPYGDRQHPTTRLGTKDHGSRRGVKPPGHPGGSGHTTTGESPVCGMDPNTAASCSHLDDGRGADCPVLVGRGPHLKHVRH